jgi:hypothetical protein
MWHYYFANTYITDSIYIEKKPVFGDKFGNREFSEQLPAQPKSYRKISM